MNNSNMKNVRETFGVGFQKYCKKEQTFPEKTKTGAFIVGNVKILKNSLQALDSCKQEVNTKLKEIQRFQPSRALLPDHNPQRVFNSQKPLRKEGCIQNVFLNDVDLDIMLFNTASILPSRSINQISNNYILNTAEDGTVMYKFILKETSKNISVSGHESSISPISNILNEFQKRHKKFHYQSVLKYCTEKCNSGQKLKCEFQVTTEQLKKFFDIIFHKVVGSHLFGGSKNSKRIKKAVLWLLRSPSFHSFALRRFIEKLDISSVTWLKFVKNKRTQWLLLAKVVKWFFNGFVIKILRTQLHITSVSGQERLYIRRSDWCFMQKKFLNKKKSTNTLQQYVSHTKCNLPIGVFKLIPKSFSVRPLLVTKETEKTTARLILTFLRQLYVTKYGFVNIRSSWKSVVQERRNSRKKETYLVACDVMDAFGSIIQEQLYDIIVSFCQILPEKLTLRYYATKLQRQFQKCPDPQKLCYKQYFSDKELQLAVPPGTLFAYANTRCTTVQKEWLLSKIHNYIFRQRVKVGNKIYVIAKGIVQGSMLSPVLSDIYYSFALDTNMEAYRKSGLMIRFMDDILYATSDKLSANELLDLTNKGIPRLNCRFKRSKTQTNVNQNEEAHMNNSITFIGYNINCNNLEIEPTFPVQNLHYLMSFYLKNGVTTLDLFNIRLRNTTTLKLTKLVLDTSVNRTRTIITILRKASLLQARRASCLIMQLFYNMIEANVQNILKIIKRTNNAIARHVLRTFLLGRDMTEEELYNWNKTILRILWLSYRDVFEKNKILRVHFINMHLQRTNLHRS